MENLLSKIKNIKIIQGGMGAGVPNHELAREVSKLNQLGVISGLTPEKDITRKLQNGNEEVKNALLEFQDKDYANLVLEKYFISGGKNKNQEYKTTPFPSLLTDEKKNITLKKDLEKLIVISSFTEVTLAKKGHDNPIGINFLYKIEWPIIPSLYGAMLAGVDAVLIGAGLPVTIPEVLDSLSKNKETTMKATIIGGEDYKFSFNSKNIVNQTEELKRPIFLAIINGHLAARGVRNADGYIVEGPIAGGHNPPARSKKLTENGEPEYGKKDSLNLEAFKSFLESNARERGKEIQPYWFAGNYANRLPDALNEGAKGVQVGTPFALSRESKIIQPGKEKLIKSIIDEKMVVYTDPLFSPSGYPFKVAQLEGSLSDEDIYHSRKRVCNAGYLVDIVERNGNLITRCKSEPISHYKRKGGKIEDTKGKKCLCNGLLTTVGIGNLNEPASYTLGSNQDSVRDIVKLKGISYTAKDVIEYILKK